MKRYKYSVIVEREAEDYFATCPVLPECTARGNSRSEVLCRIREAILICLEDRMGDDEEIPRSDPDSLARLEVMF